MAKTWGIEEQREAAKLAMKYGRHGFYRPLCAA